MSIKNRLYCNSITEKYLGKNIKVSGWVNKRRDHGGLIFIDLRDKTGMLQIVFDKKSKNFKKIEILRNEFVIEVIGLLRKRNKENINLKIKTGKFELIGNFIEIINISKTPVFEIEDSLNIEENIRLKYRYLDLRRPIMQENILKRHRLTMCIRNFLDKKNFLEIETPILGKSTPEGARDYLVPSRIYPGNFFALPQSPQQYKQILMIAGIEKYFQIAKCFRDEDLRADRQPEFTQLDIEMSFVKEEDIILLINEMMIYLFKKVINFKLKNDFNKITYNESINLYGTDHPDTRFDLKLKDLTSIFKNTSFNIFNKIIKKGGSIKGINAKKSANIFSRKDIDKLINMIKDYGVNGLSWIEINNEIKSPVLKFFSKIELDEVIKKMNGENGDILFFVAGEKEKVNNSLSLLRLELAKRLNLIDDEKFNFIWITEFPLFKKNKENKYYESVHHMFTHPNLKDMHLLEKNPIAVRSLAYDLVLNGIEIGGGSIRIHKENLQRKIFNLLGFSKIEAEEQFGFLLDAFNYGAPPHGGIAFGLDRLIMIMMKCKNIRDIIAFPKTQSSMDLMCNAPSKVTQKQLEELSIKKNFLKNEG